MNFVFFKKNFSFADLRVMIDRAQGYKDGGEEVLEELHLSELQVKDMIVLFDQFVKTLYC